MSEVLKFTHPEVSELLGNAQLAAIELLLADPDALPATLEAELYIYRDVLNGIPDPYPEKPPQ